MCASLRAKRSLCARSAAGSPPAVTSMKASQMVTHARRARGRRARRSSASIFVFVVGGFVFVVGGKVCGRWKEF